MTERFSDYPRKETDYGYEAFGRYDTEKGSFEEGSFVTMDDPVIAGTSTCLDICDYSASELRIFCQVHATNSRPYITVSDIINATSCLFCHPVVYERVLFSKHIQPSDIQIWRLYTMRTIKTEC